MPAGWLVGNVIESMAHAIEVKESRMGGPLEGVRVVEVANWTFVPAAGAILADLGADVIKVEAPTGDPQRALRNLLNLAEDGPNPFLEVPNRGKRSFTADLTLEEGRQALNRVIAQADVFLTSNLAPIRKRLRIEVEDVRAANPNIIYVRGTGWGAHGPMADVGGYDVACGWATSGMAYKMSVGGDPLGQPPAFFDMQGANTIAGAVGMALFKRERTGETSVVDVSLMNVAMWALSPDIVGTPFSGSTGLGNRMESPNPIVNTYKTKDDRWLYLVCLQADRFWAELCTRLGVPELIDDERFVDTAARYTNRHECIAALDAVFNANTLDEVHHMLDEFTGVWAPVLRTAELRDHPQVGPNGFLPTVVPSSGNPFQLVASPMRFDDVPTVPAGAAPELGQHTEEILLETGLDWDEIGQLRESGGLG
jgi:crotonobetainyl-CoA:carnitine CoA-transferase CaiB-like acyl-CoA transferase